ncbi:unnamed protein product [Dibothriocephalus latus]|uniref:Uncharacterized protein n=1 Tax=Dibothriocephalus latus TaxID=60516 RepID=A0A3P7NNG1_DIBLA|nr:unnamed protein product [Dibothriocephalus latus]
MPALIRHWKNILYLHSHFEQQITELAARSSVPDPVRHNSNLTADFVSYKDNTSSNLRDIVKFQTEESTGLSESAKLVPSSSGKRVDQVRPRRRRSGFEPTIKSIEEADEEAEDELELKGSQEEIKWEKSKNKGEENGKEGAEDKHVHTNALEECKRGEKESVKVAWNDEGGDQAVVLTTIPIQPNAFEPANVGPAWNNHRRHRFRRRLRRLWLRFVTCGTNDLDEYSL